MSTTATPIGMTTTGDLLAVQDRTVVLGIGGTDYRLHLQSDGLNNAAVRRVDVISRGERFIEPLYGRPRRLQGTIIATNTHAKGITVQCASGCAINFVLTAKQPALDFALGTHVGLDVERDVSFEPVDPIQRSTTS